MLTRRATLSLLGSVGLVPASASASANHILKIVGKIGKKEGVRLSRDDLQALRLFSFETMTPWYTNKVRFEGVRMVELLSSVGAAGSKIVVTALNDYTTEIPISDFSTFDVILALKRDGSFMPVTDKGPYFIVYNYDSNAELRSKKYYARSAWQVATIEVV